MGWVPVTVWSVNMFFGRMIGIILCIANISKAWKNALVGESKESMATWVLRIVTVDFDFNECHLM